jgi:serine/threonine-protein kinase
MKDGFPLADDAGSPATKAGPPPPTAEPAVPGRADPAAGLQGRLLNGRYAIEKRVGEGGMAYVYRAVDRETGRLVAIKVLMARLATDLESVARLKREAQLSLKLNHPNVCGILAYGESAGLPFLVMPFLAGESLSKREARGPMPPARALPILTQLCLGLQHAHEQGVLHRDLKPENVMLVTEGGQERAVVMDFGLAKEQIMGPELNRLTATGIVLGTPEFMSPEQIRGRQLDARSDIYALGVLAFELLTTELPFVGTNAQETMLNHLTGRPRRLRSVVPSAPEALDLAVDRALRVDPAERFASMAEFGAALARIKT